MIQVVCENEKFIVCVKPAHVLSVPSRDRRDERPCLGLQLQDKLKREIFPVHRLDFEVSGLMLYALNAKAHKASQEWFFKKTISKKYEAVTSLQDFSGWPENVATDHTPLDVKSGAQFFWRTQIQRGKKRSFESTHGEWAETKAVVRQIENDSIYWDLFPLTGKPHQLRLELARHGFPIHGDVLYGSKVKSDDKVGISLQAVSLDLSGVHNKMGLPTLIDLKNPKIKKEI